MAREPHVEPAEESRVAVVLHRRGTCPWLEQIAKQNNWPACFHDARQAILRRIFTGGRLIVVQVGPGPKDPTALDLLRLLQSHWTPLRVIAVDLSGDGGLELAVRRAGVTICFPSTGSPTELTELVGQLLACCPSVDRDLPSACRSSPINARRRPTGRRLGKGGDVQNSNATD